MRICLCTTSATLTHQLINVKNLKYSEIQVTFKKVSINYSQPIKISHMYSIIYIKHVIFEEKHQEYMRLFSKAAQNLPKILLDNVSVSQGDTFTNTFTSSFATFTPNQCLTIILIMISFSFHVPQCTSITIILHFQTVLFFYYFLPSYRKHEAFFETCRHITCYYNQYLNDPRC